MASGESTRPDLLLVAMPWETALLPSIRLGLLKAVCERAGFACEARHFNLDALEHFHRETRAPGRAAEEAFGPDEYQAIAERSRSGLGDWIFAAATGSDATAGLADPFLDLMRGSDDPDWQVQAAIALRLRQLASAFIEAKADEVVACRPRVLGLSLSFGQTAASLALAGRVKARDPSIRVVVGGSACQGPMGIALARAFPQVDVVVRGEADRVLPELLEDLIVGGRATRRPGVCFRDRGEVVAEPPQMLSAAELDALPVPDFADYFERLAGMSWRDAIAEQIALPVEASRGCWWGQKHHCTFCGLNGDGIAFRSKGAARAVEEIATLSRRHRVLRIQVLDNIIAPAHLRELLPLLRDAGADFSLFWEAKANLTRDQVAALRDAGVRAIQPGIESLSTPILALMRKGVSALQNVRLLKWCAAFGVAPAWNFLYGFPGEPEAEYARMAAFLPALGHLPPPSGLRRLCVDRFSPYFDDPDRHGIELAGPELDYRMLFPVDAATASDLAYQFAYRHRDGRAPKRYVAPLRAAVDAWCADWHPARTLVYRRGPGFLSVVDRRPGIVASVSDFGPLEAATYLACEDGADAATISRWFAARDVAVSTSWVQGFLDQLASRQLVFVDDGKALALALPANPERSPE